MAAFSSIPRRWPGVPGRGRGSVPPRSGGRRERRSRVAVRPRRALVIQTLLTGPVSSAQRLSQGSSDTSYISGQRVRSRFPTVNTRPTSPAQQARAALGVRLREIRKGASLTARDLAITFGCHFSKISRIENGVQTPSEANIKAWCRACNAERQIPDLIATARAIESMYVEWRRRTRAGMKRLMLTPVPLYERTTLFRIYGHSSIPGLSKPLNIQPLS